MTLGDRIAVLQDGCVQRLGTPIELYEKPAYVFVATFIGNPGVNVAQAELATSSNDTFHIHIGRQPFDMDAERVRRIGTVISEPLVARIPSTAATLRRGDDVWHNFPDDALHIFSP